MPHDIAAAYSVSDAGSLASANTSASEAQWEKVFIDPNELPYRSRHTFATLVAKRI